MVEDEFERLEQLVPQAKLNLLPGIEVGAEVVLDSTSELFRGWPCMIVGIYPMSHFLSSPARGVVSGAYTEPVIMVEPFFAEGHLLVDQKNLKPYTRRIDLYLRVGQLVRHIETGLLGRVTGLTESKEYFVTIPHFGPIPAKWPGDLEVLALDR
jgi:hypothetical protein